MGRVRSGRRWLVWAAGALLAVLIALVAFRVSPWPGALVIRTAFDMNGARVREAMEKHRPPTPVSVVADLRYRAGDDHARLDVYHPADIGAGARLPVVIWTHGGAWLSGDKSDDAPYFALIAAQGFSVVGIDYSLAPGATYPAPLHQLNDGFTYLEANATRLHLDMDRVVLAGDSAGANLSAEMAAIITDASYASEVGIRPTLGPEQLQGVVLNCGIYKVEGLTQPDPRPSAIVGWGSDVTVWAYSGTRDFSDPIIRQMSPYYHVTGSFPPTYLSGGNADPLSDAQSRPLAAKLRSLGVEVTPRFFPADHRPALQHEYQFDLDNVDGRAALAATVAFVRDHTR
jgi:acetyl esterase